ncbi:MAG: hypothetical protein U9Q88_19875 [Bacillota bacterium]|nr:hypothetical protein [Bacillota bacterium]
MSSKWKNILAPFAIMMLGVMLAACGGEDESNSGNEDRTEEAEVNGIIDKETNENGVDMRIVQQVEDAIHNKFQLLDDGKYEEYLQTFDGDKNDDLLSLIRDMIDADMISNVDNIEVLYQKENEVLATYDTTLMTEVYNPDKNFNRDASVYAILHLVDGKWKFIIDHSISLTILDADGQPDPIYEYMNYDDKIGWWAESKRLIKEGLIPSEWFHKVLDAKIKKAVSLPDQPLQMTQEERDSINPKLLAQIQDVLNGFGPPPKDSITLEELNFYPEELQNGVFMFGSFIRNGFEHPVNGLSGDITILVKYWGESGKLVELEIGEAVYDLSDFGTLEPGKTFLTTLYLDEETLLVENLMELEIDSFEVLAEFTYTE